MRLTLADHVHGVSVDGDLVLLDTKADLYLCLPAGDFTAIIEGRTLTAWPDALGASLRDAALAGPATATKTYDNLPSMPRRTARAELDADPGLKASPVGWRHLRALAHAVFYALRSARRPFYDRLATPTRALSSVTTSLLADLAVYRRVSPWLPMDGACFFRSDMLRAYLTALGHSVIWSFGVRTWPFHAHCWLQVEDMALDDEAERLAAYRPIMAV